MKHVVILGDGMADRDLEILGNKTPLDVANKPYIDMLAKSARIGLVKTVPDGFKPASDTANLSVLGYSPKKYYTGRSPLEAVSLGINMKDTDIAIRCNLVTLSDDENFEDKTMVDYSAGEISTEESHQIIETIQKELGNDIFTFYPGISYRHCLIVDNGKMGTDFTPPHDITTKCIKDHLPKDVDGEKYLNLIKKSYEILKNHPVNKKRIAEGKNPANSIWLWGAGTKPLLDSFSDKYGVKGAMISAVDLLKGIGISAKMSVYEVEGATGNVDTNFLGKGQACLKALQDGNDFAYIHIEAPDESGHQGSVKDKIHSIEMIDRDIVGTVFNGLLASGEDFAIMVLPDHATPICIRTHAREPIPFMMYSNQHDLGTNECYCEKSGTATGDFVEVGHELMEQFLNIR